VLTQWFALLERGMQKMLFVALLMLLLAGNWLFSNVFVVLPLDLFQFLSSIGGTGCVVAVVLLAFWSFGD